MHIEFYLHTYCKAKLPVIVDKSDPVIPSGDKNDSFIVNITLTMHKYYLLLTLKL